MTTTIEKPDLIERLCNVAGDDPNAIYDLFMEFAREIWSLQADRKTIDAFQYSLDCFQFHDAAALLKPSGYRSTVCDLDGISKAVVWQSGCIVRASDTQTAKTPATALAAASLAAHRAMKGDQK